MFSPTELDTDQTRYDMYKDVEEQLASKRGEMFTGKFLKGLPIGLELPNGVTVGA